MRSYRIKEGLQSSDDVLIRKGRSGGIETHRAKGNVKREAEMVFILPPDTNIKDGQQLPEG